MKKKEKRLGQVSLFDKEIIKYEVNIANLKNKKVLEVGSGDGNLTEEILKFAKSAIAVEKDKELASILGEKFKSEKEM